MRGKFKMPLAWFMLAFSDYTISDPLESVTFGQKKITQSWRLWICLPSFHFSVNNPFPVHSLNIYLISTVWTDNCHNFMAQIGDNNLSMQFAESQFWSWSWLGYLSSVFECPNVGMTMEQKNTQAGSYLSVKTTTAANMIAGVLCFFLGGQRERTHGLIMK